MTAMTPDQLDAIKDACARLGVARLYSFGSAARFRDSAPIGGDAGFLVDFAPGASRDIFFDLEDALASIVGAQVYLVDRPTFDRLLSYIRRRILQRADLIYGDLT